MDDKKLQLSSALALALPIAILLFNTIDLISFVTREGGFFKQSIYQSEAIYMSYLLTFSGLLIVLIILAWKKNWIIYGVMFVINLGFFLYPIICRYM